MKKQDWLYNQYDKSRGIKRKLGNGIESQIFVGDNSMLSLVRIEPNSLGKIHSHPEEQWGFLLEGECIRIQDGEEVQVKAGDFWWTPSNVEHGIKTGDKPAVVLDIFSPPREEYRTGGEGFGEGI